MKTYTIEEAINDMALSAGVAHGNACAMDARQNLLMIILKTEAVN